MVQLLHRVRVFLFEMRVMQPRYLLLRPDQGLEGCWGPIHGSIGFDEKLEMAIRREVSSDTGLPPELDLIDLGMPARWELGDECVIEWVFGARTRRADDDLVLDERWAEFRWADFALAYPTLELDHDRAAILRLHTMLTSAA